MWSKHEAGEGNEHRLFTNIERKLTERWKIVINVCDNINGGGIWQE